MVNTESKLKIQIWQDRKKERYNKENI